MTLLMFSFSVGCYLLREKIPFLGGKELYLNEMHTFPMLILSVCVFMYFKNLEIGPNKVIAFFAKSTFAVYLVQINAVLRVALFRDIFKLPNYYHANPILLCLYILITALATFLIATFIETARRKYLEEPIFKIQKFDRLFGKIDDRINGIEEE